MTAPTLRTQRLLLRPFRPDDREWVYRISLDPEVARFVEVPQPYRIEHADHFVRELATRADRAEFAVEAGGRPVGRVGFGLNTAHRIAQIGYWVDPGERGRGYATEAARAACRWAFDDLGLGLIEWRAEVGNIASRRVAERVGFVVEATLRGRLMHRGELVDAWVGSLLPGEAR